jgi:putative colanic acid biosynthesis glycosyltransferase
MKIVQINSVYNSGSTGRIAEGIADAARRRGHQSWVAYGRAANPGPTDTYRISGAVDHAMHGLHSLAFDGHGLGSVASTRRLVRWLEERDPDLVCLHNVHGYYVNVPLLFDFLKKRRKPVVWTLHDCWPLTGHCANFDRFACEKWKTGCHDCPMTSYYPRSLADRSGRNWAWKKSSFAGLESLSIVTPSVWLKRIVEQSFLANYPVRVIPNGVDLATFAPNDAPVAGPVVLAVANHWNDAKGLGVFAELRTRLPDAFRIVLVGLEERQIAALPHGVEGIARTQDTGELAALYAGAAVFVNPTYSDNFPTTNLEALACGTPVATFDTGGSPESLSPRVGRVVAKGAVAALADAVLELAALDRDPLRQDCREHAVRNFDRDHRFADYAVLFERLAGQRGPAASVAAS